jgi:hypothetical protein
VVEIPEAAGLGQGRGGSSGSNGDGTRNTTAVTRSEWNEYRVDWSPGLTEWLVNNVSVAKKTYGVPTQPCHFNINMWSNGGEWSGEMQDGGEARVDVEWVEMVFNVSGAAALPGACAKVCGVDGQAGLGSPRAEGGVGRTYPPKGLFWTATGWLWFVGFLILA